MMNLKNGWINKKTTTKQHYCGECALFAYEDVKGYGFCEYLQYGVRCSDQACDNLLPKAEDDKIQTNKK